MAGLIAVAVASMLAAGCSEPARPRNAVLIVIDTLRTDRMSLYGAQRSTTPRLDRIAEQGVTFENVVTNSTWTLPAFAGLLSGRYLDAQVLDHGLRISLVENLRAAGFRTAAFTEGGFVSKHFGFDLGFETFREQEFVNPLVETAPPEDRVAQVEAGQEIARTFELAREWLREVGDAPFFLMLHTYEPHTPYLRRTFASEMENGSLNATFGIIDAAMAVKGMLSLSDADLGYLRALYDGGVLESDRHVAALLAELETLGRAQDTLVVVTSDHGEDLGDREPPMPGSHGHALFDEQALVPLFVLDPTRRYPVSRVPFQVRSIDTLHTILDRLGLPPVEGVRGRSLVPLMEGLERDDRMAWTRVLKNEQYARPELYGIRTRTHKLTVVPEGRTWKSGEIALFDLMADPGEQRDVSAENPEERARMLKRLRRIRSAVEAGGLPTFARKPGAPASVEDRLRSLGYVE
jgi:arylsulfatase A-like enzyme